MSWIMLFMVCLWMVSLRDSFLVVDINKDEPMVKFCCNKEKYTLGK